MAHSLSEITGIDPRVRQRLEALGIWTVEQLVQRALTPAQTFALANAVGIPLSQLTELVNRGNLLRLDGLDVAMVNLLSRAGVDTIQQLSQASATSLRARLFAANAQWQLTPGVPGVVQIQRWIDQAKELIAREQAAHP